MGSAYLVFQGGMKKLRTTQGLVAQSMSHLETSSESPSASMGWRLFSVSHPPEMRNSKIPIFWNLFQPSWNFGTDRFNMGLHRLKFQKIPEIGTRFTYSLEQLEFLERAKLLILLDFPE